MFKEYQSKPIIRKAYEIQAADIITAVGESTSTIRVVSQEATDKCYDDITFKHYEPVRAGDFIVYLTRDDVYHCSRAVFLERNIV